MKAAVMEVVQAISAPSSSTASTTSWCSIRSGGADPRRSRASSRYLSPAPADRDMELEISDSALDLLGNAGFDPVYGARPLKRAIQQQLENPLKQILQNQFASGDTVVVDQFNGTLQFRKG
jgi:ATP-dependent Clp protease ATP-binding subunit ClpB